MNNDPFEKYRNESDPVKRDRVYAWRTTIDLQAVDGLEVSDYLIQLAIRNIEGEITFEDIEELLRSHYQRKSNTGRTDDA